jgi:O-antigen/teichoic acid export membrane protein
MFSSDRARGLLSEGRHMLWGGIGTFLAFKYDDLAVGTLTTTSTLGHYQRAYDLSLIPMSVVGGVMSIAGATYAQVKTDRAALSEAVSFVLDAIALIVLPASVGLVLIAPEAVPLVYGKKWEAAVPMLQLLLLYSMVRPLNDSLGALAPTLNRVHVIARYGIIQSAVMVIACSLLTWIWGAYGAAISAGLTVVVGFVVLYYYLLRGTVDIDYLATFGPPVTASVLGAAAAVAGFLMWTPASLPVTILYKGAIFSLVFGLCLMLLGRQSLLRRMRRLRSALTSGRQPVAS